MCIFVITRIYLNTQEADTKCREFEPTDPATYIPRYLWKVTCTPSLANTKLMSHFSCSDRLKFQKWTSCHDMSSYHDIKLFDIGYKIMTVCHDGTPACVMLGSHPLMRYTVSTASCSGPPNKGCRLAYVWLSFVLWKEGEENIYFCHSEFSEAEFPTCTRKKETIWSHTVDREIFTLKISCVKNFCVVKFSQFCLI